MRPARPGVIPALREVAGAAGAGVLSSVHPARREVAGRGTTRHDVPGQQSRVWQHPGPSRGPPAHCIFNATAGGYGIHHPGTTHALAEDAPGRRCAPATGLLGHGVALAALQLSARPGLRERRDRRQGHRRQAGDLEHHPVRPEAPLLQRHRQPVRRRGRSTAASCGPTAPRSSPGPGCSPAPPTAGSSRT